MIIKRIIAYAIDIFIISVITAFLYTIPAVSQNQDKYLESYNNFLTEYTNYIENNSTDEKLVDAEYKMVESSSTLLIIEIATTIIYFSIIPYFTKGKTLGKKIFKLQVVSNNNKPLNPGLFFLRGLISSLVIVDITNILALILGSKNTWIEVTATTSLITSLTYIISLQLMIFRKDRRALHDLIGNTKVIDLSNTQKTLNT